LPEIGDVYPGELIIGSIPHMSSFGFISALGLGVGATDIAAVIAMGEFWLQVPESIKVVFNGDIPKWVTGKDLALYIIGRIGVAGALNQTIELSGNSISNLSLSDRYAITNMIVETGAVSGLIPPDKITREYSHNHHQKNQIFLIADQNANYSIVHEVDVSELEPLVATPHSPDNVIPLSDIGDVEIDRVVIGSSSSGTIEELQAAAQVFEGHLVHPHVRTVVVPGTQQIYLEALRQGFLEIFLQANCVINPFTNGGCVGNQYGVLDEGERCVITGNQNFQGVMGHSESEVYITNTYVAAASAIAGKISSPADILR
jgi:3-isopropylmalate/(R)-2-methylmalate dehydratase large subunit